MPTTPEPTTLAGATLMAEAARACMRETAELHNRLTSGWLDLLNHGMLQPSALSAWSLEAMRLTAETTLRNIEHCQQCARKAAGKPE